MPKNDSFLSTLFDFIGGAVEGFSDAANSSTAKGESLSDTIRTVHSLAEAMARYKNNRYIFISPNELRVPEYVTQELDEVGIEYTTAERLESVIGDLDILYMTRVQKERFFNEQDYIRLKDSYILDNQKMTLARKNMIVLHPLPRVNEIAPEVDDDPRAAYFKQVKYGMYVRMALIAKLTGVL
ncbi:MAG: hypothetical protein IJ257_01075 [Treponema sp.]|nr:hypothetical protein [Treponema sp.]